MPRAIWKGAISFGLAHVPVAVYPAPQENDIDFDWLDKRTMDPVGYKRINKRTGKEIEKQNMVKGVKHENGEYVGLGEDEISAAYPRSTQTIEDRGVRRSAGHLVRLPRAPVLSRADRQGRKGLCAATRGDAQGRRAYQGAPLPP